MNKGKTIYNEKLTFYKRIGSYRKPEDNTFKRETKMIQCVWRQCTDKKKNEKSQRERLKSPTGYWSVQGSKSNF